MTARVPVVIFFFFWNALLITAIPFGQSSAEVEAQPSTSTPPNTETMPATVLERRRPAIAPGFKGLFATLAPQLGSGELAAASTGSLVINNSNVDASVIPQASLDAARLLDVLFDHQSTGFNILSGIDDLASQNPTRYSIVRAGDPVATWYDTHDGIGDFTPGSNGDPQSKVNGFNSFLITLGYNSHVQVALMKFCWIDFWPNTSYTGQQIWNMYQPAMQNLVTSYPNVKFVWVTAPLQTDPTNNKEHAAFNNLLRQYIAQNGGMLFDLADMESHNPQGNLILDSYGYPALYSGYTTDGGHLNDPGNVGRDRVANAWWSLMARIAGW